MEFNYKERKLWLQSNKENQVFQSGSGKQEGEENFREAQRICIKYNKC